jgi:hypothetical protein
MIQGLSVSAVVLSPVAAELFVAAVLSWMGFYIHKTLRNPETPPAEGVLLDLSLGLVAVTAAVFWLSASLKILF